MFLSHRRFTLRFAQAEDKINANDKKFKQTSSPNFGGSLQHNVMFTPPAQLWTVAEQGQASLQAPQVTIS
jgi:hypothetical protein